MWLEFNGFKNSRLLCDLTTERHSGASDHVEGWRTSKSCVSRDAHLRLRIELVVFVATLVHVGHEVTAVIFGQIKLIAVTLGIPKRDCGLATVHSMVLASIKERNRF